MKRACELCKGAARLHCESDQASLCWDCDAKVHSANFLVARHSRTLLCRVCQSPTPWYAAGSKLEPTFSDCRKCANRTGCEETEGEEDEDEVAAGEEQEVVENQVALWSSSPPPPVSESSLSGGEAVATRKRARLGNHRDLNISKPPTDTAAEPVASGADSTISRGTATRSRKFERTSAPGEVEVKAVKKLHREEAIPVSDGAAAVDLNLSLSLFRH